MTSGEKAERVSAFRVLITGAIAIPIALLYPFVVNSQWLTVGNQAWVWGSFSMTMFPDTNPVEDIGSYVEIWSRRPDGSWRVALDIFNSDVPPLDEQPPGE